MFLKNKNIIFRIRRSKVTDYAALNINCKLAVLQVLIMFLIPIPYDTFSICPTLIVLFVYSLKKVQTFYVECVCKYFKAYLSYSFFPMIFPLSKSCI